MARINILTNFLTDVANSIRSKTGKSETIAAEDFDTEIESIETGGALQTKSVTITENGTTSVTPDTGYDGLSSVSVTTNVSSGIIPDDYIELEYIETNSNGYIKLNYKVNSRTHYLIECQLLHSGAYDGCLFGSRSATGSKDEYILWHNNSSNLTTETISPRRGGQLLNKSHSNSDFPWRKFALIDRSFIIDGTLDGTITATNFSDSNLFLYLFGLNNNGVADTRRYRGRIKYFKIFENFELFLNLIPVKRKSDNIVGLYDSINKIFYTNELDSNFIAGPEKNNN